MTRCPPPSHAGVDALRALKASNPDLMGLAAKMAKVNSLTNLAQLGQPGVQPHGQGNGVEHGAEHE